jgi:hypothetical protein
MAPDALPLSQLPVTPRGVSGVEHAHAIDFKTDPEIIRAVAEGVRLAYGHLFNPAFTTEISMIDPLPHSGSPSMTTCCPSPVSAFSWETSPARVRPTWPVFTFAR